MFFLVQLILPGRWVPGYVINPKTGEPRKYRLNGILVFAIAVIVWAFELTGMPRDWFYRSTIYALAGGTLFSLIFTVIAVYSQPRGRKRNPIADLWVGRAQELSFFKNRFDVKMYFYVVGGELFVNDPGLEGDVVGSVFCHGHRSFECPTHRSNHPRSGSCR